MRWIIGMFALTLVGLQIELWFGDNGMPALRELEQAVSEQSAANQALAEENDDLKAEILNLNSSTEAAEERARTQLGLKMPDETFFQVPAKLD